MKVGCLLAGWVLLAACGSTSSGIGRSRGGLQSPYLRGAYSSLQDELEVLRRSAPGLQPPGEGHPGLIGRTYRAEVFELVSSVPEVALARMVQDHLEPDPVDFVFYSEIAVAQSLSAASFEESLRFGDAQIPNEEATSLRALTRALAQCVATLRSHIDVYVVRAGWADAVGESHHGVVLVDLHAREALWVHVFESWTT